MLITEDLLLRNGYFLHILPTKEKFFVKKTEELQMFDNEYCTIDKIYMLTKKYGSWQLVTESESARIKDCETYKNFYDSSFDELKNENYGFIYLIHSDLGYKIGKTYKIKERMNFFNLVLPFDWTIVGLFMVEQYHEIESKLHNYLKEFKIKGEWFQLDESLLNNINLYFQHNYNSENLIKTNIY